MFPVYVASSFLPFFWIFSDLKEGDSCLVGMCLVYLTLDALLALYGDGSTVPLGSPVYGYISDI